MRYLVLSDIHSNDEALTAVLSRVRRRGFDRLLVLGDIVGYGADPNAVVDKLRKLPQKKSIVRGNHDRVAAGLDSGDQFNALALEAAIWSGERLSPENRRFLAELPQGPLEVNGKFLICHGSPLDEDAYIFSDFDAYQNFGASDADVCFFGHSHIPSVFVLDPRGIHVEVVRGSRRRMKLARGSRYLINPGSVGQPRDRNPAAAFAIYDSAARVVQFERVSYDVEKARAKIYGAGLPEVLGDRLLVGA